MGLYESNRFTIIAAPRRATFTGSGIVLKPLFFFSRMSATTKKEKQTLGLKASTSHQKRPLQKAPQKKNTSSSLTQKSSIPKRKVEQLESSEEEWLEVDDVPVSAQDEGASSEEEERSYSDLEEEDEFEEIRSRSRQRKQPPQKRKIGSAGVSVSQPSKGSKVQKTSWWDKIKQKVHKIPLFSDVHLYVHFLFPCFCCCDVHLQGRCTFLNLTLHLPH